MATPTALPDLRPGDVHVDVTLMRYAVQYPLPQFYGRRMFPVSEVANKSDRYPIFFNDDQTRRVETAMGPKSEFPMIESSYSTDSYVCDMYGLAEYVADQTLQNATEQAAQEWLAQRSTVGRILVNLAIEHELQVKTILTTSGNYASANYENMDTLATRNFDDSGADPLAMILAKQAILTDATGIMPNELSVFIGRDAFNLMLRDAAFLPTFTPAVMPSLEQIRNYFGWRDLVVLQNVYNSANKGATPTRTQLWPNNDLFMLKVPTSDGDIGTGRTFAWNGVPRASGGQIVQSWRDANNRGAGGTNVSVAQWWAPKAQGIDSAGKIKAAVYMANLYNAL